MSPLPLAGKVAVITASSRSIGASIAQKLAADGANVVVNYVNNSAAADSVVNSINNAPGGGGKAISVQADSASLQESQRLLDAALKEWGRIDILVWNAAHVDDHRIGDVTEDIFDAAFNTNVRTPLFLTKAAASHMQPGGRIIFMGSALTINTNIPPNRLIYAATKGATTQITRGLAKEFGGRGITVNCVAPGPTDTATFNEQPTEIINMIANLHPSKRIGKPDEVAEVVAFIASEGAAWVNGQTINVNGGYAV